MACFTSLRQPRRNSPFPTSCPKPPQVTFISQCLPRCDAHIGKGTNTGSRSGFLSVKGVLKNVCGPPRFTMQCRGLFLITSLGALFCLVLRTPDLLRMRVTEGIDWLTPAQNGHVASRENRITCLLSPWSLRGRYNAE